ncbi:DUF2314 domain-containing protein [Faecalibacter rhinopitheci]|uniref:DUF2314 domain-containing protein n=1 Tax=Faecalibacter rhinopitheci TaxID=2779678 RepID=A0A8J7FYM8_9FLAO|nr:DUF2314 domain-containing protein [Faecalibacter rhinopitheci]MBF0598083.1 DUF2314 domain-containing protein [Faecalibacter rhinopitheci]
MKKSILIVFAALALTACDNKNIAKDAYKGLDKQEKELAELDSITKQARSTFDDFKLALEMRDSTMSNFFVKEEFLVTEGERTRQEHLWIRDIYQDGNVLKGIIDNQPVATSDVKVNDTIVIDDAKVSDWMFYKREPKDTVARIIGGYSVKFMRNKLSEAEKIEFDKQYQASFD